MAACNIPKVVQHQGETGRAARINSFMRFSSLTYDEEGDTRQMVCKEDKSLNAVSGWGALVIHPPSHLHSLSVWPYPTCMTPDHSSSLYPSITPVTSSFHFSAPRPELPSPVTDDTIRVDYLGYHVGYMVKYLLTKVIIYLIIRLSEAVSLWWCHMTAGSDFMNKSQSKTGL